MNLRSFFIAMSLALVAALSLGIGPGVCEAAQGGKGVKHDQVLKKFNKVTRAEQKAAAKRAKDLGLLPGVAGAPAAVTPPDPGGIPHYFGPYANWAYSPLPTFGIASVTVDNGGTGYTNPSVTITDVYGTGTPLVGTATVSVGVITGITIPTGGSGFHVPFVTITDPTGTGAAATATLDLATLTGGMHKFVDGLPGLTPAGANGLGQYIPLAASTPCTFSSQAAHCYEIALVEFKEKMHSDLQPTRLRGYVQSIHPGPRPSRPGLCSCSIWTPPGIRIQHTQFSLTVPRSMHTITPIPWGPSSLRREAHMA